MAIWLGRELIKGNESCKEKAEFAGAELKTGVPHEANIRLAANPSRLN